MSCAQKLEVFDMKCAACELMKEGEMLYEDDKVFAVLAKNPANYGHILVISKEHYTILEQVPDFVIAHIGVVVNKISMALFESMKIAGTNVYIENGTAAGQAVPHIIVNIIPRVEGDDTNLNWQPRQLDEEEMSTVEILLKEEASKVGEFESEKQKPVELDSEVEKLPQSEGDAENYLIKQLDRMP